MKQKVIAAVLGTVMAVSLAACGSTASSSAQDTSSAVTTQAPAAAVTAESTEAAAESEETAAESTEAASESTAEAETAAAEGTEAGTETGSHALIVYFDYSENIGDTSDMSADAITSASLAGDTIDGITENDLEVMKDEIQKQTGADVFSIRVTEPYAPDYQDMVHVAQEDQNNDKTFSFVEELPDLTDYDTIYFGTPVWWGQLPQPVASFLAQNDFSGKTIIPFGINLGSGFGRMISQIEEAQPDATVVEDGLTVSSHTPNDEVRSDVDSWLAGLNS